MRSARSRHQGAAQHCRCGLRGNNRPALRRVAIRESRFTRRERLGQPQAEFCLQLNDRSKQSLPVVRLAWAEGRNWAESGLSASRGNASYPPVSRRSANARNPPRVCENCEKVRRVPNFRGLWPRRVRKNRNNRSSARRYGIARRVFAQPCMGTSVSSFIACDCSPVVEACFD